MLEDLGNLRGNKEEIANNNNGMEKECTNKNKIVAVKSKKNSYKEMIEHFTIPFFQPSGKI